MNSKRLLLLNGSSRKQGTSFSFSRTIKLLAEASGNAAEIIHVIDYYDGKEDIGTLEKLIAQSDIIAMAAPLYADTLPFFDIWLLEKLADEYASELAGKDFFAVGQCGFPDTTRLEPLLDCCRLFAAETGMNWLGGLAYGGGGMINGAMLEKLGKKGERMISGFRLALESILKGEKIPSEAQELLTLNIPKLLYPLLAAYLNHNTRKEARKAGNPDYARKVYLE